MANIESLLMMLSGGPAATNTTVQTVDVDHDTWNMPEVFPDGLISLDSLSPVLHLPPLSELLPVVDNYFQNYNFFIPLFDESLFTRMLLEWQTSKQSTVSWAAINVVQALSYRILEDRSMDDAVLSQCVRNAQSVLAEVMMNAEVLGLQVLLGMAVLNQGSALASVLMGSAARMIQSLSQSGMPGNQMKRILSVAYILDRVSKYGISTPAVANFIRTCHFGQDYRATN